MDISVILQPQVVVPVGFVVACAILVFVFGFKKTEQPPFAHFSSLVDAERKAQAHSKKKAKSKDKRAAANGQVTTEKASPSKKSAPKTEATTTSGKKAKSIDEVDVGKTKEQRKQDDNKTANNKKSETKNKENKVEQAKNKKNLKNSLQEKPVDYDEGDWELAYSRKEKLKKKKEEETPSKKSKKSKKVENEPANNKEQEKSEVKDKVAKETENKELKEKDSKATLISNEEVEPEQVPEKVEELPAVKESPKVEKEEKKSNKGKKGKKNAEAESAKTVAEASPKPDKKATVEPVVENKAVESPAKAEPAEAAQSNEKTGTVAFDELGDVWKEAKAPKKSKKKTRKDN